jgi:DUF438 domain-containing protein
MSNRGQSLQVNLFALKQRLQGYIKEFHTFNLQLIQQIADTNEYLWREVENKDEDIGYYKRRLEFLWEVVTEPEEGETPAETLEKVKDILAEPVTPW